MKKRLLVDMDGTLARFHDQDMYLERMYEKNFFRDLVPFQNMVDAIRDIVVNHPEVEVYICSAKVIGEPPYCEDEKNAWLDEYLPEIDRNHRIYTDIGRSKADYLPGGVTKDDYLLDDYNKGLNLFLGDGGSGIKVMNNINMKGLGAYGGDKDHMWTGPLVCTESRPCVIVGDILESMGLERNMDAELESFGITPHFFKEGKTGKLPKSGTLSFKAHQNDLDMHICSSFGAAMNYLDADTRGDRRLMSAFDGVTVKCMEPNVPGIVLPRWQLNAICTNRHWQKEQFNKGYSYATRVIDDIRQELENGYKPIYGKLDLLDGGEVVSSVVYHDPDSLKTACKRCNESYQVEWYLPPQTAKKDRHLRIDRHVVPSANSSDGTQEHQSSNTFYVLSQEAGEKLIPLKTANTLPEIQAENARLEALSEDAFRAHIMKRCEEINAYKAADWVLTDDDSLQYTRGIDPLGSNAKFELCQIQALPNGQFAVCHGIVDADLPEEKLCEYLRLYGYEDLDDYVFQTSGVSSFVCRPDGTIDRENSPGWIVEYGMIAEMIFEIDFEEYMVGPQNLTWNQAVERISRITGDPLCKDFMEEEKGTLSNMLKGAENRKNTEARDKSSSKGVEPGKE